MYHEWIIKSAVLNDDERHGLCVVINDGQKNVRKDFLYPGRWKDTKTTEARVFIDLVEELLARPTLPNIRIDIHTHLFDKWLNSTEAAEEAKDHQLAQRANALRVQLSTRTKLITMPPAPKGMRREVTKRERSAGGAATRRMEQLRGRPEVKTIDEFNRLDLVDGAIDNYMEKVRNDIVFTRDQEIAYGALWEFFFNNEGRVMTVIGSAGTGKTSLTTKFAAAIQQRGFRVAMTAPTNKASQVMTSMSGIECRTIHKLLGLTMDIDDTNPEHITERLVKEPWMQSQFPSNHLVIVDEASMVSKALRFGRDGIQYNISRSRTKVVFLGDECQLPPVGEHASVVFSEKKFVKIEEVVRQAKGNPLLEVLVGMRDRLMQPEPLDRRTAVEDGKGIKFVLDQRELLNQAIEMFGIQKESGNAQYCRLLAWTNEQVKFYNFTIRNKLIGNAPKNFIKGEVVICLKPVVNADGEGLAYSSQELAILEHEEGEDKHGVRIVKYSTEDVFSKQPIILHALHDKGIDAFRRITAKLYENARSMTDPKDRRKAWKDYFQFKSMYADLAPGYALTAHRAQGSTFQHVLVDEENINKNNRVKERNQCKYVALSRARETAIVL